MSKNIKFCTMYLPCSNVELVKDVGQIPYTLSTLYGMNCTLATCNIHSTENNQDFFRKVKLYPVKHIINYKLTGLIFLLKNAKKFDWINFYHGGRTVYYWSKFYHFLNPKGKIYLKLDMDFRLCDKYDKSEKEKKIFRKTVENADFVSVETFAVRDRIQQYTKKKIHIITNGYQENKFLPNNENRKENCFITVGRLGTKQKATDILLKAFALSANQHDWNLKLVGPIEEEFKKYIDEFFKKEPELKNRIFFLGEINDRQELYGEYHNARVFILPSRWESFGLVTSEALSCGCRVIVSDEVPPKREFTKFGEYGAIVKAEEIEELSQVILEEACRKYDKEEVLSIKEYAREKFSWEVICSEIYNHMML